MKADRDYSVVRQSRASRHRAMISIGIMTAAVSIAGLIGSYAYFSAATSPSETKSYTGSIVISSPNRGDCRRLQFDNTTGHVSDAGRGGCPGDRASEIDRFTAIANGFQHR